MNNLIICQEGFQLISNIENGQNSTSKESIYKSICENSLSNYFFKKVKQRFRKNFVFANQIKSAVFLIFISLSFTYSVYGATFYSVATGKWSKKIWSNTPSGQLVNTVPGITDSVFIQGYTVTVDINTATCATLTIGSASLNSRLSFNSGRILTVANFVTILSGTGTLDMTNGTLNVGGNFTNNGSMIIGTVSNLVFNGNSQQLVRLNTMRNLTINNTAGVSLVSGTGTLTISGFLSLTNGVFNINGNNLTINKSTAGDMLVRTNGTLNASAGTLTVNNTAAVSFPVGFTNTNILNLNFPNTSSCTFNSDTILATNITYSGSITLNHLKLIGNFTLTRNGSGSISFYNRDSAGLTLGDGNYRLITINGGYFNTSIPNLTVNCSSGSNIVCEHSGTKIGSLTISKSLKLISGTFEAGDDLNSFSISDNVRITRDNGLLKVSTNYNYGNNVEVNYTGSLNQIIGDEIKSGDTVNHININLRDASKIITTKSTSPLYLSGNLNIIKGNFTLGNILRMASGKLLTVQSLGILNTNNRLVLSADSLRSAAIGNSSGTVNGNVCAEIFISGGKRAFRLIGSPFSEPLVLDSLMDDIHITGQGGASNGFDPTSTNNPSAFTFSESSFSGLANSGWSAMSSTSAKAMALRVLYRGPRSQVNLLNDSKPIPQSTKLDCWGGVNNGNVGVSLDYSGNGANMGWNLVRNPFLCQIDMQSMNAINNLLRVQNTYSVWNVNAGTRGAYQSYTFGVDGVVLPIGGAFFVRANGSNPSINFLQSNKSSSTSTGGLLKSGRKNGELLEFELWSDDTLFWDQLQIKHSNESVDLLDGLDGEKMTNPDVNLYSLTPSGDKLAIDSRPNLLNTKHIWLGIQTGAYHFTLKLKNNSFLQTKVYLIDHYSKTRQEIKANWTYNFEVTSDSSSFGEKRFELVFEDLLNSSPELLSANNLNLYPNPTNGSKLFITNLGKLPNNLTFEIYDISGIKICDGTYSEDQGISIENLKEGVYFMNLNSNETNSSTKKFIKSN